MPDIERAIEKDIKGKAKRFWYVFGLVSLIVFLSVVAFAYYFISPQNTFFFSNNGRLICVNRKPWGFAKQVETSCYLLEKID